MLGFAIDLASYAGVVTPAMARKIVEMGFTKFIVNLWNDGILYDINGRKPWELGYIADGAKTTTNWQVDSAREAGAEVDGYIYYYASEDASARTLRLLGNLQGRTINFLWLDWEEGMNGLSVEDTIAYMHKAQDTCIGIVYTGHYTRRNWWIEHTNDYQGFAGQWIWDATNDKTPDMSYIPYGGFKHYMEQYAFDVMLLPEMSGPVDLNVFYKPDEQPAPVPEPEPVPELPPAEEEAPVPVEKTPVEEANDAVAKLRFIEEQLHAAIDEVQTKVAAIPAANLASIFNQPYRIGLNDYPWGQRILVT
ncbi:MAG: hypothetical protein E6Q97_29905 [Desulfurellales bacterium]|nr:MAG: hypothetical protein E6Q97_29905 [Desulfurellales bacterium]